MTIHRRALPSVWSSSLTLKVAASRLGLAPGSCHEWESALAKHDRASPQTNDGDLVLVVRREGDGHGLGRVDLFRHDELMVVGGGSVRSAAAVPNPEPFEGGQQRNKKGEGD